MKKLTSDTARELLGRMWDNEKNVGLTIRDGYMLQALEIALPILEQREKVCPKCGGTGMADSGGTQPWGEPILIECDCQLEQQGESEWIEWGGGEQPLQRMDFCEIRFRNGEQASGMAYYWVWHHSGDNYDIIAYRPMDSRQQPPSGKKRGGF